MVYTTFKDVFLESFVMYLVSLPIYVNLTHLWFWFSCSCLCFCFLLLQILFRYRCVVFIFMNNLLYDVNFFLFL